MTEKRFRFSGDISPVRSKSETDISPVDVSPIDYGGFNSKSNLDVGPTITLQEVSARSSLNVNPTGIFTKPDMIVPSYGGRELRPMHVHIMAKNKDEWNSGRGMVDTARKLSGKVQPLRADSDTGGVHRTYPDGSSIKIFNNAGITTALIFPVSGVEQPPEKEEEPKYKWDYEKSSNEFLLIGIRRPEGHPNPSPSYFQPYSSNYAISVYEGYAELNYDNSGSRMYVYEPGAPGVGEDAQPRMILSNLANTNVQDRSPRDGWKVGRQRKFIDRFWSARGGYLQNWSGFGYWESLAGTRFTSKTMIGPCYTSDNLFQPWDAYTYNYHPDTLANFPEDFGFFSDVRPTCFHIPVQLANGKSYDQIFVADPQEGGPQIAVPVPEWKPPYPPYTGGPPPESSFNVYSRTQPKVYEPGNTLIDEPALPQAEYEIEDFPNGWEQEFRPSEPFIDGEYKALHPATDVIEFLVVIGTGTRQAVFEFYIPYAGSSGWVGVAINVLTRTARLLTPEELAPYNEDQTKVATDMGTEFLWGPYAQ